MIDIANFVENPGMVSELIKTTIERYKPYIYDIAKSLLDVYKDYANNKEYFETIAKARWNLFQALTDNGFSKDQAIRLVVAEIEKNLPKNFNSPDAKASVFPATKKP